MQSDSVGACARVRAYCAGVTERAGGGASGFAVAAFRRRIKAAGGGPTENGCLVATASVFLLALFVARDCVCEGTDQARMPIPGAQSFNRWLMPSRKAGCPCGVG